MKKFALCLVCVALCSMGAFAQKRTVSEVRKSIESLSVSEQALKNALNAITPTFTDAETAKDAEAWYVGGKAAFGLYDKYIAKKALNQPVDANEMGNALLLGYKYYKAALPLDSVVETEKNGQPKLDKKTGLPKIKTKFSKEIVNVLVGHHNDYNQTGWDLYDAKNYTAAANSWGIYCDMAADQSLGKQKPVVNDTIIAALRFYEGVSLWQDEKAEEAIVAFDKARATGFAKKEVYDYEMSCAAGLKNDEKVIEVAKAALPVYGKEDSQYIRIVINDLINKGEYAEANTHLDQMLAAEPDNIEINGLKGLLLETEKKNDEALVYFKKAVEADPNNARANFDYGRQFYNKAVRTMDENPDLTGAKLHERIDPIYKEALKYLEKCFQLDPDNTDCKNALKRIYYQLGDDKKLEELENM